MKGLKKILALAMTLMMVLGLAPMALAANDVEGLNNELLIKKLVGAGILDLYVDGAFRPDADLTRGELAKAIVLAFNLGAKGKAPSITDAKSDKNLSYISIVAQNGVMSVDKKGKFFPKSTVRTSDLVYGVLTKVTGGNLPLDLTGVDLTKPVTRGEFADYLGAILGNSLDETGIVKAVSKDSITVAIDGKDYTHAVTEGSYIFVRDGASDISEVQKGNLVSFVLNKSNGKVGWLNAAQDMDYPTGVISLLPFDAVKVDYLWETVSDSPDMVKDASAALLREEADDTWYKSGANYLVGEIALVEPSLKVFDAGKELKVIPATQAFDPAVVGDEVQLKFASKTYSLVFEKAPEKDEDLKVTYKKGIYSFKQVLTTSYLLSPGFVTELNGKPVRLPVVANRPVQATLTLSMAEEVTYISAFYRDLNAKVEFVEGDKLTIRVDEGVAIPFSDTVVLAPDVIITAADGSDLKLEDLKPNTKIILETEPFNDFKVGSIKLR